MADAAITVTPLPAPASQPPANSNAPGVSANVAPLLSGLTPSDQAMMAQQQKAAQDLIDSIKQNRADRQAVYAKEEALKPPTPPTLQNTGAPPPGMPDVQPVKAFGNWAVALAMLGSLLTRRPLTAALKAGAAAMGSYTQARWHDYQIQRQVWQDAMDQAMRQNQVELDQYRMAYNQYSGNLDTLNKELERIAGDNQDNISLYQIRSGLLEEQYKLLTHREDMQQQYLMRREMAADRAANRPEHNVPVGEQIFQNWMQEYTKAHGHPPSAQEQADFAKKNLTAGSVTGQATLAATAASFDTAQNLVDQQLTMLKNHPYITGAVGSVLGKIQGAVGQVIPGIPASPQKEFESNQEKLKTLVMHLLKSRAGLSGNEEADAATMIQGTGNWDDPASSQQSLSKLKGFLYELQGKPFRYNSVAEVQLAYQNKELSYDDAAQILVEQFGATMN